jgi:hypothetical protein
MPQFTKSCGGVFEHLRALAHHAPLPLACVPFMRRTEPSEQPKSIRVVGAITNPLWNFLCAIITATALVRKMANPSNQPPAVLALMRA